VPKNALKRIPFRNNYNDSYFDDYYQGIPINGWNTLFWNMIIIASIFDTCKIELNAKFSDYKEEAEKIIYTGAIDEYFNYCYGRLDWRSLKFNFVEKNINDYQGISVMHYPELKYPYTRITEFKHFNPFNDAYKKDFTVYAEEIPCNDPDNPYYPVETEKNIELYQKYKLLADAEKNVFFAGRLGTYKYNNMDVTVENALNDYERLIKL
jgi:UDP-galactopyranose mutase